MWVDTGLRLVNVRDADKIEIVREIADVRGGDRAAWTYSLTAIFGERVEPLMSVTTYPPRDTQALDDLSGSVSQAQVMKLRHTQAATAECARCLRAVAAALRDGLPYCSLEGLYESTLDPAAVERE